MKKSLIIFVLTSLILSPSSVGAASLFASFTSPEGIKFESYSKEWNELELKALYTELLKNEHGTEINHLEKVEVSSETPAGQLGLWTASVIIDLNKNKPINIDKSKIQLFHADTRKTIEEMAFTLSHEYGHHFTHYWLINKEGKLPSDASTQWAKFRQLDGFPVRWKGKDYNHFWQPEEIMADDFAVLFGSPTGKNKLVYTSDMGDFNYAYTDSVENVALTPAENINSLREYWVNLSGMKLKNAYFKMEQPKITSFKVTPINMFSKSFNTYNFTFSPATLDKSRQSKIQYIIGWGNHNPGSDGPFYNVKSPIISNSYSLTNWGKPKTTGQDSRNVYYEIPTMPKGKAYFRVFAYDTQTKQLTYSQMYWYDFSNPSKPIPIKNPYQPLLPINNLPTEYKEVKEVVKEQPKPKENVKKIKIIINGEEIKFDSEPYIINGTTMIPMRGIFEKLGAEISWDNDTQTVSAIKGETTIKLTIGQKLAFINDEQITLLEAGQLKNSRTMVPLRFVSEALRNEVEWNGETQTITINSITENENSDETGIDNQNENTKELDSPIEKQPQAR